MREPEHAPADTPEADARRPGCRTTRRPASRSATRTATNLTGDPVRIQIRSTFNVLPILGVGSLSLKAKATMRLEHTQDPHKGGLITGDVACS